MANRQFGEMIEQLKQEEGQSAQDSSLIALLEAKQEELSEDATPEQVHQAVQECIRAHLASMLADAGGDAKPDEEMQSFMNTATSAVTAFFEKKEWHYDERISQPDLVVYELGFNLSNCNLRMRVHIEGVPKVCRVEAIFPISADKTYEYLLCKAMANSNYPRRFGALQYDERDGEVSYRYSYPIGHGVYEDDLERTFLAVAFSASDSYAEIRKHCIGKYKSREIGEILKNVNALVSDLSDDDV